MEGIGGFKITDRMEREGVAGLWDPMRRPVLYLDRYSIRICLRGR